MIMQEEAIESGQTLELKENIKCELPCFFNNRRVCNVIFFLGGTLLFGSFAMVTASFILWLFVNMP